ncbi:hypothetical protein PENSPDRAFT_662517 [Peniophora sp. CONT]|nr:hypothetical protein PENSPDRAFT_662517 [Peniophora sp. CONT]
MTPVRLKHLRQFSCTGLPEDAVVMWRYMDVPSTVSVITESTFTGSIAAMDLVNPVIDLTIGILAQPMRTALYDELCANVIPYSDVDILPMFTTLSTGSPWVTLLIAAEQQADTESDWDAPFATIISSSTYADALMMCRTRTRRWEEMPKQTARVYTMRMLGIRRLAQGGIAVCASTLLRSYTRILGAHNVRNLLIGPESWVPTVERDWREILQHPRGLVYLEIHAICPSVQSVHALVLCLDGDACICPELEEVVFRHLWPSKSAPTRTLRLRLRWTGGKRRIEWSFKKQCVV